MNGRGLFLDTGPGEVRGVVLLDGLPERLFIEREGVRSGPRLGARYAARVSEIARDLGLAYLDLGGETAVMPVKGGAGPARGAAVEVEVTAEPRAGKAAVARLVGPASAGPGLIAPGPSLEARLAAAAPAAAIATGDEAREVADEAEEAALAVSHTLPGGIVLAIEPTRALVAIDVDRAGAAAGAKGAAQSNLAAIRHAARLVRLKSLGGTIVIDLIGFPAQPEAVRDEARRAFDPDQPGVTVLAPSRLGLLQVSRPHRERPVHDLLCDADGRPSARSMAQRLARALAREGRADPGARIVAACAPEVAAALAPLLPALGPRFQVARELGWDRLKTDIRVT